MSKLSYYLNTITLEMFYYSLFYLYIKYCISAWSGAADCYLKPTVCMQKRVIKYVCREPALTTTNPLLKKKTCVLKLNGEYKLQICKPIGNTITGFNVENKIFTFASSVHLHNGFPKI